MNICPVQCIVMRRDREGFDYPVANPDRCISCGRCEDVCPMSNELAAVPPSEVLAARNADYMKGSSSGGVFPALARNVVDDGGVVYGAVMNPDLVVSHTDAEDMDGIERMRGSKYVQSELYASFEDVKDLLEEGRRVMFTGTPCQIAGLKRFLHKEYKNLKTVDVVCHGTPSPLVWRKYLDEVSSMYNIAQITDIQFRNKAKGWKSYSISISYNDKCGNKRTFNEVFTQNIFMRCFLSNLCLRSSCYACPARNGKSGSDITLADLWGAENICPGLDDDKGVSLVLLRNKDFTLPGFEKKEIEYSKAVMYNPSIESDVALPDKRDRFFRLLHSDGILKATVKCTTKSRFEVLIEKIIWNIKNRVLK